MQLNDLTFGMLDQQLLQLKDRKVKPKSRVQTKHTENRQQGRENRNGQQD